MTPTNHLPRVPTTQLPGWERFEDCEAPDFFEVLDFAQDGGFSEVKELWYVTLLLIKKNQGTYNGSYEHHHKIMITTYDGPVG